MCVNNKWLDQSTKYIHQHMEIMREFQQKQRSVNQNEK